MICDMRHGTEEFQAENVVLSEPKGKQQRFQEFHFIQSDQSKMADIISSQLGRMRIKVIEKRDCFDEEVNLSFISDMLVLNSYSGTGFIYGFDDPPQDVFSITFTLSGASEAQLGRTKLATHAGMAAAHPAHMLERLSAAEGTRHLTVSFPVAAYVRLAGLDVAEPERLLRNSKKLVDLNHPQLSAMLDIAQLLCKTGNGPQPMSASLMASSLLRDAFMSLFIEFWPTERPAATDYVPKPAYIKRAVELIHAHAGERLTLEDLINAAGVGGRSLQLGFKAHFGVSPIGYIAKVRLMNARRDLLNAPAGDTIQEIAYRWGFPSASDFAARFQANYGQLPSELRHDALRKTRLLR